MKQAEYDAFVHAEIMPDAQHLLGEHQPLPAIAFLMSAWDASVRRASPDVKKEVIAMIADAITDAGGDGRYFKRRYLREQKLADAVKDSCGHLFWMDAVRCYKQMLRGEVAPEQVYSTIESDLQLAGKTSSGRTQTAANPPTIARAPDEAKRIRNALAAYGWDEVPVTDADREVMRATIDAVMQRHMAHAHMHVSDHGRSR